MGLGNADNTNFYFNGDKAYTEDDVCVYNLFVRRIPAALSYHNVLAYFAHYGEVVKLHLKSEKKSNKRHGKSPKLGFVHYAKAQAAAKVLQTTDHVLHKERITVKAAYSWDQPGAYRPATKPANDLETCGYVSIPQPPTLNILDLNDDCLEQIAKLLDLHDQVRMARTCTRFRSIIQMCSKVEHKVISLRELTTMTLWEIRDLFLIAGKSIESLTGDLPLRSRERIAEIISSTCPNVISVHLDSCTIKTSHLRKFIEKMTKVTTVTLHDCTLKDNALMALTKLPKLEKLNLSKNFDLTGKHLSKITTVRDLDLNFCRNISEEYFIDLIQSMKELRTLNIEHCDRFTNDVFVEMERHCNKLEELHMCYLEIAYNRVARLPALKRLVLTPGGYYIDDSLFAALAKHMSTQLEYLKISARNSINLDRAIHISQLTKLKHLILVNNDTLTDDCLRIFGTLDQLEEIELRNSPNITNGGLMSLLRRCTKLRLVNIQRCQHINDNFIFDAIEILRYRQKPTHYRNQPVVFNVFRTSISEFVMSDAKCLNAESLLKLVFCSTALQLGMAEVDNLEEIEIDFYDEFDDIESLDDEDIDFVVDLENNGEQHHMYNFSDMDDDEFHHAYNLYGREAPFGNDINDYIW